MNALRAKLETDLTKLQATATRKEVEAKNTLTETTSKCEADLAEALRKSNSEHSAAMSALKLGASNAAETAKANSEKQLAEENSARLSAEKLLTRLKEEARVREEEKAAALAEVTTLKNTLAHHKQTSVSDSLALEAELKTKITALEQAKLASDKAAETAGAAATSETEKRVAVERELENLKTVTAEQVKSSEEALARAEKRIHKLTMELETLTVPKADAAAATDPKVEVLEEKLEVLKEESDKSNQMSMEKRIEEVKLMASEISGRLKDSTVPELGERLGALEERLKATGEKVEEIKTAEAEVNNGEETSTEEGCTSKIVNAHPQYKCKVLAEGQISCAADTDSNAQDELQKLIDGC